ncbi:MAG: KAP family NTPase, partial [Lachnospiraceae bacterium]|nr:KAP family NTPase [Lachnospiraceae bacterium]
EHTYFPVYYNAWLYDNHSDPLMSLILSITKACECYYDTKLSNGTLFKKITSLMDSFSFSIGYFQIGSNIENIKGNFTDKDILSVVKMEDEIRDKVKEIFDSLIVENVEKLVIFIDELDRCRPSFAIEMLERIKHYFDDDRIIFVASINREQLTHLISKYYGTNFDSTGYLDRFFDWNIYLPELDTRFDNKLNFTDEQYFIENITKELCIYYQLSPREKMRYNQCISFAILSKYVSDHGGEKLVLSAFVSIITILNIKDEIRKRKFLQGDSSVLDELFQNIQILHRMACRFGKLDEVESEENFKIGYAKIKEVYDYAFGIGEKRWYKGAIEISDNFKEICLRICSGLRISKSL